MTLRRDFLNKIYVSSGDGKDQVEFQILDKSIFQPVAGKIVTHSRNLTIDVPMQMKTEEEYDSALRSSGSSATTMWFMLIIFILMKLLYSVNMDAVWSTISFA